MHFIDLPAQQRRIKDTIDANIQNVLAHGQYIMGPEISELEKRLAAFTHTRHAISCASGTDALLMALMAYDVGPGDAVFTTPFTFIATAEVISLLGATPVFVDIDPATFNIDPVKLKQAIDAVKKQDQDNHPLPHQARHLTPRGVIPVDLFGLPADYDAINAIARDENLFVIEDAAQSLGATYKGKPAGSPAHIACTSFFPAKPLGCYGDGGMCFTDDDEPAAIMRSIRVHGQGSDKYENIRIGINGRLDTLQAAILLAKLDIFPEEIELRQKAAQRYTSLIATAETATPAATTETPTAASGSTPDTTVPRSSSDTTTPASQNSTRDASGSTPDTTIPRSSSEAIPATQSLVTPAIPPGYTSAWAQYSLLARDEAHRSRLMDTLKQAGIPSVIYYPKPLHLQTAYAPLGYSPGDFPISEDTSRRIFSLPMHPYLTKEDQETITAALQEVGANR